MNIVRVLLASYRTGLRDLRTRSPAHGTTLAPPPMLSLSTVRRLPFTWGAVLPGPRKPAGRAAEHFWDFGGYRTNRGAG